MTFKELADKVLARLYEKHKQYFYDVVTITNIDPATAKDYVKNTAEGLIQELNAIYKKVYEEVIDEKIEKEKDN